MKSFWKKYSYDIVKVFLFHLVCGMFGATLSVFERSTATKILLPLLALGIYLFLLYGEMWKLGARDATRIEKRTNHLGVLIGMWGTVLNWVIAVFMLLWFFLKDKIPQILQSVFILVSLVYNGIYLGFLMLFQVPTGTAATWTNGNVWVYFLIPLPTVFICWLGYYLGRKEKHLTKLFISETPEEKEIKAEQKKARKAENEDE